MTNPNNLQKSAPDALHQQSTEEISIRNSKRAARQAKRDPSSFYNRQFAPAEQRDLADPPRPGVQDEIELLRVAMRRTMELARGLDDLAEMRLALNALSTAAARLADLMRVQNKAANSQENELAALLEKAITMSWEDLRKERQQANRP